MRIIFGTSVIMIYLIILFSSTIVCSSDADVVQEDNFKIVQAREDVNLTCTFSKLLQPTTAWFKQTADRKNLLIVSLYLNQQPSWNEDFDKTNRFNVIKGDDHFNLTILKTKPSDSATYYCLVSSYYTVGMGAGTRLLVKDAAVDRNITIQQSLIDMLHPGDSVSLHCSIFTESCAGEHSVYWFRQSLGESQGILYTKGERNGQCENSTESQTQSCVYNLFKSNISHSDAGIYYCAVAACGEILFGKGTKLKFRESVYVNQALLALGILNIIFLALVVFLGIKLCRGQNKMPASQESQNEDTLNYAAISFGQKPLNTRRAKAKISQDQSLYAHVRSHQ
uniref:Ig-like domain-containing protein n=1 Tax=Cyprinus carpio TaxID=7962 RepID=A0A8C1TUB5_CYPCA